MTLREHFRESQSVFVIGVKGNLDSKWNSYFGDFQIYPDGTDRTSLCGRIEDQSALLGTLGKLHGLGLTITYLVRIVCPFSHQDPKPGREQSAHQNWLGVPQQRQSNNEAISKRDGLGEGPDLGQQQLSSRSDHHDPQD